jgi:hypothetical protein
LKDVSDISSTEQNLHTIPGYFRTYQKEGETGMLYYTVGIDEKTWEMLEKICTIKNLTPDQLIKQGIENTVEKEYLDII